MTIESLTGSRAWLTAGWTMLHFLWVGGAIGLIAAAGRRALRRASPEARYGAALLSLGLLAAAPMAIAWRLSGSAEDRTAAEIAGIAPLPFVAASGSAPIPTAPMPALIVDDDRPRVGSWLDAAASALPWLWIAGTPTTFALLAAGLAGAERLRRRSRILPDGAPAAMTRRLADAIGIVRPVAVGVCDRLAAPILLGVIRPLILLPPAALAGWSAEQLEMALWHELAHVRRLDNLVNLAQRLVESVLFFHPAVWWVSGWIRLEREHCCDRFVVARTGRARPYAELLAELALAGGRPGRAAVAMAESPIVSRIRFILNPEDHVMSLSRPALALAAAILIAPAALIAASRPGAPGPEKKGGAAQGLDQTRLDELIRRTRQGAQMHLGVQDRAHSLIQVAGVQARTGDRDAARRTFREAEQLAETVSFDDNRYSPHILMWIVWAEARLGFRDEAIATGRKLLRLAEALARRETQKLALYPNLMKALVELGDKEGIREVLRAGSAYYTTKLDPGFDVYTPIHIASLQAASGDLPGALRMVEDPGFIKRDDAFGADRHHRALFGVVGAVHAKNREGAGEVLEAALRDVARRKDDLSWMEMVSRNQDLQVIARAQSWLGLFDEAMKSARMIVTETVPERLVEERVADVLDEQRFRKTQTMAEVAREQAKAGDKAGARRTADEAMRVGRTIRNDTQKYPIHQTAAVLAMADDLDGAMRLADTLILDQRLEVYGSIAAVRREAGDEAGARKALQAAVGLVRKELAGVEPGTLDPDTPTGKRGYQLLEDLGRSLGQLGDRKAAIETIRRINDGDRRREAMRRLASSLASAGDLEGALAAVDAIASPKAAAEAMGWVAASYSRREPVR